jgi:hypothetical protein
MASIYPVNRTVIIFDAIPEHYTVFQHTPSVQAYWWTEHQKIKGSDNVVVCHDEGSELLKQFSLQGFTHVVSTHLHGGQILNIQVVLGHLITQEEVPNIQSPCPLTGTLLAIGFQNNGTLVVLVEDVVLDGVSLCLHEELGPQYHSDRIISANQLSLGAASGDELLLARRQAYECTIPIGHHTASMASEIRMDRKAGIHVPLDDSKIICRQVELVFSCH